MSQILEVPAVSIKPPHGLNEILATFGDIFSYVRSDHTLDPRWQVEQLIAMALPFPLALSWDPSRQVRRMTCHKLLQPVFEDVFQTIHRKGLAPALTSFGGCFAFRPQRRGTKLSAHCWGIALDLNPACNAQGTGGNMDAAIISIFREAGFTWGGDWQGAVCDPMHFQFCTGY
jgi:hypothetical protein